MANPVFAKDEKARKRAALNMKMDRLNKGLDELGFKYGRIKSAAEGVKKKLNNKVIFLAKSVTLSNQITTPPCDQVEELQITPHIV